MDHSEEDLTLSALRIATGSILPMALKTAVELDLFELIQNSGNPTVSPAELAALLPTSSPGTPKMLDRILRLFAANSLLVCTTGDAGERRYALGPLGKFFTNNEDGVSLKPATLLAQEKLVIESWYGLKESILEGGSPFKRIHGTTIFGCAAKNQNLSNVFNGTMANTTILLKKLIAMYNGFEGIKSLVDIGGGTGAALSMIISKYPSIKGINFDLPHVIKDAPPCSGIEHVAGDMFASIPKGDAIFMKWITHSWSDEDCVKILRKCREALPENGKVILVDYLLPDIPIGGPTAYTLHIDVLMLAYEAQERTESEFRALAQQAGFKDFRKVCSAFALGIMELYK